jgi:ketosteroid isomerase-like protein
MRLWLRSGGLVRALAAACLVPVPAVAQGVDTATVAAEVRAADRLFALETAARGLEGWMRWMAPDVLRPEFHGPATQGKAAVRARDSVMMFGRAEQALLWRPTESGAFADGRHGWTRGVWSVADTTGATIATGQYLTIWRRDAEGWRVLVDTGVNDPPPGTPD